MQNQQVVHPGQSQPQQFQQGQAPVMMQQQQPFAGQPPQQPQHAVAQQPPQQQHFPHQGLNGGWQSDKDYQERRKMIANIVRLLQQRKPNAPQEWLKKLPQMAKRLEESLYRSAKSFEEYNDASTLKNRLQQLAVNIGMKTKRMQQQQQAMMQQQPQQPRPPQPGAVQQQQPMAQVMVAQPQQQPAANSAPTNPLQQKPMLSAAPQQPPQQPQQQQRMVNLSEINPIMGAPAAPAPQPVAPAPQAAVPQAFAQQPAPAKPAQPQQQLTSSSAPTSVSDRQQVLRHQQQRLLLLRHAAKCQHEDGRCPVTPHCAGMKRLWKHIAECKNQKCLVPHCVSSRYVLSHYHRCKDVRCPVCGPVREAIHRSHEKQKQMQALKQRHQQAVAQQQQGATQQKALPPQQQRNSLSTAPQQPTQMVQQQPQQPGAVAPPSAIPQPLQHRTSLEPAQKRRRTSDMQQQLQPQLAQPASAPTQQQPGFQPQHPGQPVASAGPTAMQPLQPPVAQPIASGSVPAQAVSITVTVQHGATAVAPNAAYSSARPQAVAGYPQQPGVQPQRPAATAASVASAPGIAFSNGQVIMPKHTGPKPHEDHTLINTFSVEQIETHIASLNKGLRLPPQKLKTKCLEVLRVLQSHQHGWVFNSPVDPVELGLPDYFEVIKKPMDLGTIRKKLDNGVYQTLEEFQGNVLLTFDNAMLYNPEGSVVYNMAKEMKAKFQQDYDKLMQVLLQEEDVKRKNGEACLLCGCEKLLFEPPVFYCNGLNCPSKRIRRNSYYYIGGNNQYHWCHQCFQELRDNATIDFGDLQIKKESLVKKKNDEVHEESWVQCDRCERWVHQICALFNTRQNKDQRSEYACPKCTIVERKRKGNLEATSASPMAEDLPRTVLSEYLETHVRKKVTEFVDKKSVTKSQAEGIPVEEARKKVEMGGVVTIRQVTSMDRKLEVRERMKKRYAFKDYPDEFNFRCKCIVVFQNLDGVDVILFGLYVYEHDESNPEPNKRAVYVSYLDSVHYMRPRSMRTFVYHEILIAYLDYVRRRGFSTAHIWACPPLKGDDYILYAKPEDQKTPKDDRLRQWYIDMLIESQRRGIVGTITNMYDLYFSDPRNDATIVPYMDGDYFPAEVENIIKDMEEGKKGGKKNSAKGRQKDKKAKQKKKSGRGGTRSAGLDEDALKASGFVTPGLDGKTLEEGGRDYVMQKLGETIQPMKESFIVAYLAWKGAKEETMVVPPDIQEYRDKHNITWKLPEDKSDGDTPDSGVSKPEPSNSEKAEPAKPDASTSTAPPPPAETPADAPKSSEAAPPAPKPEGENAQSETTVPAATNTTETAPAPTPAPSEEASKAAEAASAPPATAAASSEPKENGEKADAAQKTGDSTATPMEGVTPTGDSSAAAPAPAASPGAAEPDKPGSEPKTDGDKDEKKVVPNMVIREGKFAAMAARKRDKEGVPKEAEPEKDKETKDGKKKESKTITVKDSRGRLVKVLDDDDEELDCEFLNNRQAFLNLCQGNHYQFDQVRRAKHSSMMVLWHLHNRDAPKFVQQCATCSREILSGYRFHCSVCADFDQCQECVSNPKIPRHPHPLKPMPVGSGQQNELTAAQREERQRSIQLHMKLLLHAATCTSPKCPSANCTKMKGLLKHGAQCTVKASGGCNVCKRIWALLQIHARQCKNKQCPVPNCMAIRERFRQLKKQQQAMDDRRRLEMNRAYRGKR